MPEGRGAGAAPRWSWPRLALAALLVVGAIGAWLWIRTRPAAIRRDPRLNVLLITVDTLRADALGAYGQARPTSPTVDRIARAGVRFDHAHAHNVVTLPSHANILSGRYPFDHGIRDNAGFRFPAGVPTLATLLKERGRRTGAFVSGFPLDSRFGLDAGFEVYDDAFGAEPAPGALQLPERTAEATVTSARRWLESADPRPFFCWIHLYDPHAPYRPPPAVAARFGGERYLGEVAAVDAALAPLLQPMIEAGPGAETLVVFTADHGESLGEHGEAAHGLFAYEATLRVPLVLFAPALLPPRVVEHPARHVDLLPTVLDALGAPIPQGLPGRSLLPAATGHAVPEAPSYFEALSGMLGRGWAPLYGTLRRREKYVELPLPELYDLESDAREERNLAATRPELLEELRGILQRFPAREAVRRRDESAEIREHLAALGYVTAAAAPLKSRYTEADDPKRLVHLDRAMEEVIARHREGDLGRARETCLRIVAERPDMSAALLQLAILERKMGGLPESVSAAERAFNVNPDDLSAVVLLAGSLSEAGRGDEAVKLLQPYLDRADAPLDVLTTAGTAHARLGRHAEALAVLARAQQADPSNAMTLVQIATVHLARRQWEPARRALEKALALDPGSSLAHHQLGLIARERGDAVEAERRFREALRLDPGAADSLLNLGLLLARDGRAEEARPLLERFLAVAPASVYAREMAAVRQWLARSRAASG